MSDNQLLKIAIKKCENAVKWDNLPENMEREVLKLLNKSKKGSIKNAVRALVDVFEICDEYDAFDSRCKYPGCGKEIKKLVDEYM